MVNDKPPSDIAARARAYVGAPVGMRERLAYPLAEELADYVLDHEAEREAMADIFAAACDHPESRDSTGQPDGRSDRLRKALDNYAKLDEAHRAK